MQKTRCVSAVEIDEIAIRNHAELVEVEMRVEALQRIERPRHHGDALREHALALRQLEFVSEIEVAVSGLDRQHVRVMRRSSLLVSDEAVNKAD